MFVHLISIKVFKQSNVSIKQYVKPYVKPVEKVASSPIVHNVKIVHELYDKFDDPVRHYETYLSELTHIKSVHRICGPEMETASITKSQFCDDSHTISLLRRVRAKLAVSLEEPSDHLFFRDDVSITYHLTKTCPDATRLPEGSWTPVASENLKETREQLREASFPVEKLSAQFPTPHTHSLFLSSIIPKNPLGCVAAQASTNDNLETVRELRPSSRLLARVGKYFFCLISLNSMLPSDASRTFRFVKNHELSI